MRLSTKMMTIQDDFKHHLLISLLICLFITMLACPHLLDSWPMHWKRCCLLGPASALAVQWLGQAIYFESKNNIKCIIFLSKCPRVWRPPTCIPTSNSEKSFFRKLPPFRTLSSMFENPAVIGLKSVVHSDWSKIFTHSAISVQFSPLFSPSLSDFKSQTIP